MKSIVNKTRMQEQLVNAVRFTTNNALNADKIGDDFVAWKSIASAVQPYAYAVYAAQENHEDTNAPMSALIENGIKPMLAELGTLKLYDKDGTVHDAPITIDDDFKKALGDVCAKYAGRMGKKESTQLQFVRSQLSNTSRTLRDYEGKNGVDPEAIESLKAQKAEHEARIAELLATPDESVPEPMPVGDASFRKALEIHMGRTLTQQKAMTWETYQAKKEAKRLERRAATKSKKSGKKAESK